MNIREAVIVGAVRTPVGKRGGALSRWHPADLLGHTLRHLVDQYVVDAVDIGDVIAGYAMQHEHQSGNVGRHAVLAAGLPESVPAVTIDLRGGVRRPDRTGRLLGVQGGVQAATLPIARLEIRSGKRSLGPLSDPSTRQSQGLPSSCRQLRRTREGTQLRMAKERIGIREPSCQNARCEQVQAVKVPTALVRDRVFIGPVPMDGDLVTAGAERAAIKGVR